MRNVFVSPRGYHRASFASGVSARRRLLVIADRVHAPGAPAEEAARSVLIDGDRIVAIGPADVLRARAHETLDLSGTVLTPGLCDAHIHLTEWALARRELDLSGSVSAEDAASRVEAAARERPGTWLRGRGWNANAWTGGEPHRALLDRAAGGRPVALQSHDMHSLWASTRALERAGIGDDTPDPEGGRIVRDAAGSATGLLLENAARLVVEAAPGPTFEDAREAVLDAQRELHRLGITAVHSFPGIHVPDPDPLPVLEALEAQGLLRLRVLQHIRLEQLDEVIGAGLRSGRGSGWIRFGAVKMFLDGALGSCTAWMAEPYRTADHRGIRTMEPDDFRNAVRHAAAHGIASTVHAIGDAAVALAFDVLSQGALRVADLPHRVEHVQCCPADALDVPGRAGIVCSVQPCHLITDWRAADRHWGAERAARTYAFASLLRHGAVLAFGSDAPVEPADPRLGLFAAVRRRDLAREPEGGWFAAECLSPADALDGYTIGPARAAGRTDIGVLRPGALADLVAWDRDPLVAGDALLDMRCVATLVGGQLVHS